MKEHVLIVTGMRCQGCVNTVTKTLLALNGVKTVSVDLVTGKVVVQSEETLSDDILVKTINTKTPYRASVKG